MDGRDDGNRAGNGWHVRIVGQAEQMERIFLIFEIS